MHCANIHWMTINEFSTILTTMTPRSQAFKLVKEEMKKRGYWKNKSRGNEFKNGYDIRRNRL